MSLQEWIKNLPYPGDVADAQRNFDLEVLVIPSKRVIWEKRTYRGDIDYVLRAGNLTETELQKMGLVKLVDPRPVPSYELPRVPDIEVIALSYVPMKRSDKRRDLSSISD